MSGETENATFPMPKFYFSVQIAGDTATFQEMTGLETEVQQIAYRQSDSRHFDPIQMPGLGKPGNVTMRKGIFPNSNKLWDWFSQIKMNTITRQTMTISLVDATGTPQMVRTLNNAWATKISGTDLQSEGNEVAVESIEVANETLTISAP
jgi:phage tail-like protein